MAEDRQENGRFRFGVFELDSSTGELRKDGKARPRLQGQPLDLLLMLLNRPGGPVTREELRQRIWPVDTFVDYDHSLNAAVNKLRDALGDSADNPRFIQTIPRRGYRFIAPVEKIGVEAASGITVTATPAESVTEPISTVLSDPRELPPVPLRTARVLFSLIQVLYLGFYIAALVDLRQTVELALSAIPHPKWVFVLIILTSAAGIPIRLYLLAAAIFGDRGLTSRFRKLFPIIFPLDEIWALAPFLIADWVGMGLALAGTAALLFLPFSQRSLLLMGDGSSAKPNKT